MDNLMPDNRECAALLWLVIALLWILSRKNLRASVGSLLRAASHPKILLPIVAMFGYVALEVWLGFKLSLWRSDLMKPTLLWLAFTGLAMLFRFDRVPQERHFFRRSVMTALGITAFLEFLVNVAPMNVIAEIVLQPVVAVLAMIPVFAADKERCRSARKAAGILLAFIGFSLLGYTIHQIYSTWEGIDKQTLLRQLALPVWLTVGLLPFIYTLSLLANYELAFMRIDFAAKDRKARWRAKLALLTKLHFRMRDTRAFGGPWSGMIVSASSFSAARQVVADFLKAQRDAERPEG
jgi:hypothetical protein